VDWDKIIKRTCTHCKQRFETTAKQCNWRSATYKNKSCFEPECEEKGRQLDIDKNTKKGLRYLAKAKSQASKEAATERKEKREKHRQDQIDAGLISKHGSHKEPLQMAINAIVRYIDYHKPCFVLPNSRGEKQAGHVIGVGDNDTLRYLFANIFGELAKSNGNQNLGSGDRKIALGLSRGQNRVDYLNECAVINEHTGLNGVERKEKAALARRILKDMKSKNIMYTRIELDEMMGIYNLPELKIN
jgi:hypothetical protein